jgi:hypothetical protein
MTNTLNLRRSTDRKTTPSVNAAGTQANVHNAFGLLSGSDNSCPGQTSACASVCYAGKLEGLFPGFRNLMTANYEAVKSASYADLVSSLDAIVKDFIRDCVKRDCERVFRIHHDGDFFSRTYASAWANVVKRNPSVTFWAYTRSFVPACNVVDILAGIPNLALYLSVDADNAMWASIVKAEHPGVLYATLTETFAEGSALMASLGQARPGAACPEVKGAIPLITKAGGACFSCGLCIRGKADIRFASKGK